MERCSSQRGKQTPEIVCAVEEKEGKQCFYEQSQKLQWMENGKSWKEKYTQTRLPSNRKKNHWRSHSIKHYRSFYIKDDISHQCSQTSVLKTVTVPDYQPAEHELHRVLYCYLSRAYLPFNVSKQTAGSQAEEVRSEPLVTQLLLHQYQPHQGILRCANTPRWLKPNLHPTHTQRDNASILYWKAE